MDISRLIIVALVIAAASLCGCSQRNEEPAAPSARAQKQPVEVTPVVRRDLVETLPLVGSLAANESAEVRPEVVGQIREVYFDEGQRVTKGQVLLKIDDAELRAQFGQTEARFKLAELNLARNQGLVDSKTISQADFDRVTTEFSGSTAELSLLRVRLQRTEIKAPFEGVVGSRSISPGDYVTTATVITRIDDLSRMKIDFQVPERFISKVKSGTRFSVRAKTLSAETRIEGEVYFVSSVIDRSTRSSEVKGLLANPPPQLRPGMFANIELVLDVHEKVLTVPEGAILSTASGPQIVAVVVAGGEKTAEFIPVELGLRARGLVEVRGAKSELAENLNVVAAGLGSLVLFPGAKLDPRPLRAEFLPGGTK